VLKELQLTVYMIWNLVLPMYTYFLSTHAFFMFLAWRVPNYIKHVLYKGIRNGYITLRTWSVIC